MRSGNELIPCNTCSLCGYDILWANIRLTNFNAYEENNLCQVLKKYEVTSQYLFDVSFEPPPSPQKRNTKHTGMKIINEIYQWWNLSLLKTEAKLVSIVHVNSFSSRIYTTFHVNNFSEYASITFASNCVKSTSNVFRKPCVQCAKQNCWNIWVELVHWMYDICTSQHVLRYIFANIIHLG